MLPFWIELPFSGVMQLLPAIIAAVALFTTQFFGRGA
jgi:hypothetical protein